MIVDIDGMKKYAEDFITQQKGSGSATIIGLSGDLGAGKTTFTQSVARILGVTNTVQSPTFVLMKIYEVQNPAFKNIFQKLIHIDAYRFDKSSELLDLGFVRLASDPQNLILIEWPERVEDVLPQHVTLYFEHESESERNISNQNRNQNRNEKTK